MTGHPLREWVLFALVWAALALPVWMLTAGRTVERKVVVATAEPAACTSSLQAFASARYSGSPEAFTVRQNGEVLWQQDGPLEDLTEERILLHLDHGIAELSVEVRWPKGTGRQAFELQLAPDGFEERTVHAWADAQLDEVFVYQWPEMHHHE